METSKPYSEACDRNRDPILEVLRPRLAQCRSVLEVGSGTGQHAVYFAEHLPHLVWHTSDREENISGIRQWLEASGLPNVRLPLSLDVTAPWPSLTVDTVFSANTVHIMHWPEVKDFFVGVGELLPENGFFLLYGPFNYNGRYTSDSNQRFDAWLKARDPESGIRHFEDLNELARAGGLVLREDIALPANNRVLVWQKSPSESGA